MELGRYPETPFGAARRAPGPHGYVAYFPRHIPRAVELTPGNLMQLADAEIADRPLSPDVEEVVNYVRAMEAGLERLASLPLSVRLLREMHAVLLAGVRGRDRRPGEIRTSQNWIGPPGANIESATFVPPPPAELSGLLSDLERFINEPPTLPPLIEAALVHYQFETIHPFLDGNGRLGRLLIVFLLVVRDRLPAPLLYLSPFFEERRDAYYAALQGVRERGDLAQWLTLFLEGVKVQANDAIVRAERLVDLREDYRARVRSLTRGAANELVNLAFEHPVLNTRTVERRLSVTRPAALTALRQLAAAGILDEIGGGPRGQLRWRAEEVLRVLAEDR